MPVQSLFATGNMGHGAGFLINGTDRNSFVTGRMVTEGCFPALAVRGFIKKLKEFLFMQIMLDQQRLRLRSSAKPKRRVSGTISVSAAFPPCVTSPCTSAPVQELPPYVTLFIRRFPCYMRQYFIVPDKNNNNSIFFVLRIAKNKSPCPKDMTHSLPPDFQSIQQLFHVVQPRRLIENVLNLQQKNGHPKKP